MRKNLLSTALLLCALPQLSAQVTLLNENFDSYSDFAISGFGNWQTLDLDGGRTYSVSDAYTWANIGSPQAYIIFNPSAISIPDNATATGNERFAPHSGTKYAAAFNTVIPQGAIQRNEDWLISPAITLGVSGNNLSFWVKSLSLAYGAEEFKVGIYTGSGNPTSTNDFTIISGAAPLNAPWPDWGQVDFNLDAYAGQTVKIGILCTSRDHYMFMVDDISVVTAQLSTGEVKKSDEIFVETYTLGVVKVLTDKQVNYVKVFDVSGKQVAETHGKKEVDITGMPAGVYYVNILTSDNKVITKKVIKK